MFDDYYYMDKAYKEALKALKEDEVPVGAIIVKDNKIIAKAYNKKEHANLATAHAEILAINKANKKLKSWHLDDCIMYVTLEPCQMCAGAIVQARVDRVVIGCMNQKAGCAGSVLNLLQMKEFNHQVDITRDVLQEECSAMLSTFFKELRIKKQLEKKQKE